MPRRQNRQIVPDERGRPAPLTGGYYWFPAPNQGSVAWTVLTCHELGFDAEVGHVDLWPAVIDRLAAIWKMDVGTLKRQLTAHCYGLPRGRITRPKSLSLIVHGNDAPRPEWLEQVRGSFALVRRLSKAVFDEHETMFAEDHRKVMIALGVEPGGVEEQ